jgi:GTP cyclohydrolase II
MSDSQEATADAPREQHYRALGVTAEVLHSLLVEQTQLLRQIAADIAQIKRLSRAQVVEGAPRFPGGGC